MELLVLIVGLCTVMWYIIDRLRTLISWDALACGKWITLGVAAVFAFLLAFNFRLDLVYALGWWTTVTWMGMAMTAILMMGGSSFLAELVTRLKNPSEAVVIEAVEIVENDKK